MTRFLPVEGSSLKSRPADDRAVVFSLERVKLAGINLNSWHNAINDALT